MDASERQRILGKIIAKSWVDPEFRERLINTPVDVLREEGLPVPDGMTVRVVENTPDLMHITIPQRPDKELDARSLDAVSGGGLDITCTGTMASCA